MFSSKRIKYKTSSRKNLRNVNNSPFYRLNFFYLHCSMKLLVQLFFFGIALLLTIVFCLFAFALYSDATPQGLLQATPIDNYSDEDWTNVLIYVVGFPIVAVMIYFMLWKTNFFSRNKQS